MTDEEKNDKTKEPETLKHLLRETIGEIVGDVVEVSDMLGETTGPLVKAQEDMAALEVEEFIDKIDGEG